MPIVKHKKNIPETSETKVTTVKKKSKDTTILTTKDKKGISNSEEAIVQNVASVKKVDSKEMVSISEPVKATPIPQRKIADEKKLSTFGLTKERDLFIENLSMLVLSGMSIVGALSSIINHALDNKLVILKQNLA